MRTRLSDLLLSLALLAVLVLAPAAGADNDGRGFYGATNDKVVTNSGFSADHLLPAVRVPDEHAAAPPRQAQGSAQSRAEGTLGDAQWRGGW